MDLGRLTAHAVFLEAGEKEPVALEMNDQSRARMLAWHGLTIAEILTPMLRLQLSMNHAPATLRPTVALSVMHGNRVTMQGDASWF